MTKKSSGKKGRRSDRRTVDFAGLIEAIDRFRLGDPGWSNLSFSAKVRTMIELLLDIKAQESPQEEQTIAQLIEDHWDEILEAGVDLTAKRLKLLRGGEFPTNEELMELSAVLPLDIHQLTQIRNRTFGEKDRNGEPNGEPCSKV